MTDTCFINHVPDILSLSRVKKPCTLSDEQYHILADYAAKEVKRLCTDLSLWVVHSKSKDGIEVSICNSLSFIFIPN